MVLPTVLAGTAFADLTAFAGSESVQARWTTRGIALGFSLRLIGIEFEYAGAPGDPPTRVASLETGMINLLVHTPLDGLRRFQFYGTFGAGVYRARLDTSESRNAGVNAGGGVKVTLAGPFRLRLDYRRFALRGARRGRPPQRVYAGLTLAF